MTSHKTPGKHRWALAAAVAATALALFGNMSAAQAVDPDDELHIVVLGDSFSAGNGAGYYWENEPECHRSGYNWAGRYAQMLRSDGHSVYVHNHACSGAVTEDVIQEQASAIDEETDLILLTIGGNDAGFSDIVRACFASRFLGEGPLLLYWCKSQINDALDLIQDQELEDRLGGVFDEIQSAGPDPGPPVVLLSYPYLELGNDVFAGYPLGQVIHDLGDLGDDAQESAVVEASTSGIDVVYLDTIKGVFSGHEPDGDPWVENPARWLHEFENGLANSFEWYHPNPTGHQAYAQALYDMDLFAVPTPPSLGRLDVTFVVDASATMGSDLAALNAAAPDIVNQLDLGSDSFKLGLVSFLDDPASTGIGTDYLSRLDAVLDKGGTTFASAVSGLSAVGGGGGDDTVFSGLVEAASQPAEFSRAKRVIVHVGDSGPHDPEPASGLIWDDTLDALFEVGGMSLYTVNVDGSTSNPSELSDLASRTGGRTYSATTSGALASTISDVLDDVLAAPQVWAGGPYAVGWGRQVILDGTESWDAGGDIVLYEWDVDGDGTYDLSTTDPTIAYVPGPNTDYDGFLTLRVTDEDGNKNVAAARLHVSEDADGVPSGEDNCPDAYNPGQEDTDEDGTGDACDPDVWFLLRVIPCNDCNRGSVWGDPHMVTFDGLAYDLQTVGEHVLVESNDGSVMVQTRHEPWGSSTTVSVTTAVSAMLTDYPVEIRADGTLIIDGDEVVMNDDSYIPLIDGAAIFRNGSRYTLGWPGEGDDRFRLDVKVNSGFLNITPYLPSSMAGEVTGLLGDGDGDPSNDLVTRSGLELSLPVSSSTLYGVYGASWRISQSESLFEYGPGESTETFTDLAFPSSLVTLASLDPTEREAARALCLASGVVVDVLLDACTLDVALTGASAMIEGSTNAPIPISAIQGAYATDFEDGDGSGWSLPAVVNAENGSEKFLGVTSSGTNRLTLNDLPAHSDIAVSFDLYALGGWDGESGPDNFNTSVVGGSTLLDASFSNTAATQSYPSAGSAAQTGATAVDSLGSYGGDGSSVYHFEYTFSHWQQTLQLDFTGVGPAAIDGEFWGIDNVELQMTRLVPDYFDYQIGDDATGAVEQPRGEDIHSFSVPAGGLEVFLDWDLCFSNTVVVLVYPDGSESANFKCYDRFLSLDEGDYTLRVYSNSQNFGAYAFKTWLVPEPESFTYQIGDEVSEGVPSAGIGLAESPGAEDQIAFTVPAGGLEVFLDWDLCFSNTVVVLVYPDGSESANFKCYDRFLSLDEGDYTLRVYSNSQNFGAYAFRTSDTS